MAASGVLLLACRSCQAAPKKKKGRGSKKPKAKAKPAANGSAHKNGGSRKGGAAPVGVAAVNGGSGTRGLPSVQSKPPASGAKTAAPKPAKKAPAKAPQLQGKGKGKGKPVPEAPPVITVSTTDAVCSSGTGRVCGLLGWLWLQFCCILLASRRSRFVPITLLAGSALGWPRYKAGDLFLRCSFSLARTRSSFFVGRCFFE